LPPAIGNHCGQPPADCARAKMAWKKRAKSFVFEKFPAKWAWNAKDSHPAESSLIHLGQL
jgi:hypothetical protein